MKTGEVRLVPAWVKKLEFRPCAVPRVSVTTPDGLTVVGTEGGGLRLMRDGRVVGSLTSPPAPTSKYKRVREGLNAHAGRIVNVALLPEGRLISTGNDGTSRVWDLRTRRLIRVLSGELGQRAPCLLAGGRRMVFADARRLFLVDAESLTVQGVIHNPVSRLTLETSRDGRYLRAGVVVDLRMWKVAAEPLTPMAMQFSADGRRFALQSHSTIVVTDERGAVVRRLRGFEVGREAGGGWGGSSLDFGPDGKTLFAEGFTTDHMIIETFMDTYEQYRFDLASGRLVVRRDVLPNASIDSNDSGNQLLSKEKYAGYLIGGGSRAKLYLPYGKLPPPDFGNADTGMGYIRSLDRDVFRWRNHLVRARIDQDEHWRQSFHLQEVVGYSPYDPKSLVGTVDLKSWLSYGGCAGNRTYVACGNVVWRADDLRAVKVIRGGENSAPLHGGIALLWDDNVAIHVASGESGATKLRSAVLDDPSPGFKALGTFPSYPVFGVDRRSFAVVVAGDRIDLYRIVRR